MKNKYKIIMLSTALALVQTAYAKENLRVVQSKQNIFFNKKDITREFNGYNINDYNYFRLRDLENILANSSKPINVSYSRKGDKGEVKIKRGLPLKQNKIKITEKIQAKDVLDGDSKVFFEDKLVNIKAYKIKDQNYYKLRDLCSNLGLDVEYNQATNSVGLSDNKIEDKKSSQIKNLNSNEGNNKISKFNEYYAGNTGIKVTSNWDNYKKNYIDNITNWDSNWNGGSIWNRNHDFIDNRNTTRISDIESLVNDVVSNRKTSLSFVVENYESTRANDELNRIFSTKFYHNNAIDSVKYNYDYYNGLNTITVTINYRDADISEANRVLDQWVSGNINSTDSEYQKVKKVHDYIVNHVTYYYPDNEFINGHSKYGLNSAVLNGKGVCQAYATMFHELAGKVGLEDVLVSGEANNGSWGGHAWNIVKIDGGWYHIDTTWDDPSYSGSESDVSYLRYDYFLISDDQIKKNHIWDESIYPSCPIEYPNKDVMTEDQKFDKSKKDIKSQIEALEYLSNEEKKEFYTDLENITMKGMESSVLTRAKERNEVNKTRKEAIKEVEKLDKLTEEEKASYIGKLNNAKDNMLIKNILGDAKSANRDKATSPDQIEVDDNTN